MFFVTASNLWSLTFFATTTYLILTISVVIYLTPIVSVQAKYATPSTKSNFLFINSFDLLYVLATPVLLIMLLNFSWVSPSTSAWFGHIIVGPFQNKIVYLTSFTFITTLVALLTSTYFSSREIYDFVIVTYSFYYWLTLLFMSNSIFTAIFIIEVLSALLFMLVITSTFSTAYFYRNLDFSFGHFFQNSTPYTYLQSVLFFFWVSLLSSLNLFLFILLFYIKALTFDWTLSEYIFEFFVSTSSSRDLLSLSIAWFVLIFSLFLKCGMAPFYIWKPTFFKGIPIYTLFFYITYFYFTLFVFIIYLLTTHFSTIFYFYTLVTSLFVVAGTLVLLSIMCESFYIKSFLAVSSIINSLLVFLALVSTHTTDALLWI